MSESYLLAVIFDANASILRNSAQICKFCEFYTKMLFNALTADNCQKP